MKKTYKIDSRFYFLLLLHYQNYFKNINTNEINENILKNRKIYGHFIRFDKSNINMEKTEKLLKCVGAAIFNKNNTRYYARTEDIFDLVTSFDTFKKQVSLPDLNTILLNNLKIYKNEDKIEPFKPFITDNNFYKSYLKKEKKNIIWFITNHQDNPPATEGK